MTIKSCFQQTHVPIHCQKKNIPGNKTDISPPSRHLWVDDFPFKKVGYVSSLRGYWTLPMLCSSPVASRTKWMMGPSSATNFLQLAAPYKGAGGNWNFYKWNQIKSYILKVLQKNLIYIYIYILYDNMIYQIWSKKVAKNQEFMVSLTDHPRKTH